MSSKNWTEDQLRAINENTNVLVNAAAGSGKTAVLVERIIKKLIPNDKMEYIPIENLLVVTFARDAACEMQQRIKKALLELMKSEKNNEIKRIIKKQLMGVADADITTIDAFCIKVLRENCTLIGVDPKFRVIDPNDADILKQDTINQYFDMLYEQEDRDFLYAVGAYCHGYDESSLSRIILEIYNFSCSLAYPNQWLESCTKECEKFSGGIYQKFFLEQFNECSKNAYQGIKAVLEEFCQYVIGHCDVEHLSNSEIDVLSGFDKKNFFNIAYSEYCFLKEREKYSFDEISEKIGELFSKIPKTGLTSKKEEVLFLKDCIDMRDAAVSDIASIKFSFSDTSEQQDVKFSKYVYPALLSISKLVLGFGEFYYEMKLKKNQLEFNDFEHLALRIIDGFDEIRERLKCKYQEILIDEYQDTNGLQEEIFSKISNGHNRFIVGDMKQSIYRFRQSDPLIFKSTDSLYKSTPEQGNRVILSKNFRSRHQVLEGINFVFEKIMSEEVGEIVYDNDQALHPGNFSFLDTKFDYKSCLYVLEGDSEKAEDENEDSEEKLSDVETEAEFCAKTIKKMIDDGFLITEDGESRPVRTEDFAILMNSVKTPSSAYIEALSKRGISAYSESSGFFSRIEIIIITDFLTVIDNPYNDIALIGIMRSPVFRFSDNELAVIRLYGNGYFYDQCIKCSKDDTILGKKTRSFIDTINKFHEISEYKSVEGLLQHIYALTSIYDMCGILYDGEETQANMMLFLERAKMFSDQGVGGLFDFISYINKQKENDKMSTASIEKSGIPIMTIHKSKGLEFPVVFVVGMGRKFSKPGGAGVVMHEKYGIGLNYFDGENSAYFKSTPMNVINIKKTNEEQSEQLRKLYVAFTRASQKLIVTGVVSPTQKESFSDKLEKILSKYDEAHHVLPVYEAKKASCYLDFLIPVISCSKSSVWNYSQIENNSEKTRDEESEVTTENEIYNEIVKKEISKLLNKYDRRSKVKPIPSKTSVTALKKSDYSEPALIKTPKFMSGAVNDGASYGTAVHRIMEKIIIKEEMTDKYIRDEIQRIQGSDNEVVEATEKIIAFFKSDIGERLCRGKVYRETPFEISINAREAFEDLDSNENILLQGVIDCYFEEDGKIVLIDYKTDRCKDVSELVEKYQKQLLWYCKAIEKLSEKTVVEAYIYSFYKNEAVRLNKN